MLNGLPTFFLVLILAACVRFLYLKPLDKVLAERFRLTEGARKAAEESLKNADARISEYETKLAEARAQIYQEQAEFVRKMHEEQAAQLQAARADADARLAAAKAAIAQEAATAQKTLEAQSDALASQIADRVLARRVA